MRKSYFLASAIVFWALPALANDSTAELQTGGLVLTKSAEIEMRAEDLYISEKEVLVAYRFFNKSAQDVTTEVAFPMPDIMLDEGSNVAIPNDASDNFLDFSVVVDGKPVPVELEQKAFAKDLDVTQRLKTLGVPLAPFRKTTDAALDHLPQPQWDGLIADEIVSLDEYDAGKGMEKHLQPRWLLTSSYHWRQTFPAGKEIEVRHRYRPSVGGTVMTALGASYATPEDKAAYLSKYCVGRDLENGMAKARAAAGKDASAAPYSETRLAYVLKTGANWAAPIHDFRLVIDKGETKNFVSFCGDGVRKISDTRFEMKKTALTPTDDLNILILKPLPKQ